MKLLHIVASMDPKLGGVSQAIRTMISGLQEQGVTSEVVSLDHPDAPFLQRDTCVVYAQGPAKGPWAYSPALAGWLDKHLPAFDAVLVHGLWLYPGFAARKALRRLREQLTSVAPPRRAPRLFVMPHGMLDPYFQSAKGRGLKAWRNRIYWKLVESWVVNEADGLLFTCELERQLAREPFAPYQPQLESVVGLGVEEPPAYTPAMREALYAACPTLQHRAFLLFISRIHEKKGVDMLVPAYQQLAAAQPKLALNLASAPAAAEEPAVPALVIAGPGLDTPYGESIRQAAAGLSDSGAVLFPGMLTGDAKWGAFYACEAFVLPSHQENFGIAVVEALACGKPVLISNQINIWREIKAAGAGIVADDTVDGTRRVLREWSQLSEEQRLEMAAKARQLYVTHFAVAPFVKKIREILD